MFKKNKKKVGKLFASVIACISITACSACYIGANALSIGRNTTNESIEESGSIPVRFEKMTDSENADELIRAINKTNAAYQLIQGNKVIQEFTAADVLGGKASFPKEVFLENGNFLTLIVSINDTKFNITNDFFVSGNYAELPLPFIAEFDQNDDIIYSYDTLTSLYDDNFSGKTLFLPACNDICIENGTTGQIIYIENAMEKIIDNGGIVPIEFSECEPNHYIILSADKKSVLAEGTVINGRLQELPEFEMLDGRYFWVQLKNTEKNELTSQYIVFDYKNNGDIEDFICKTSLPLTANALYTDYSINSLDVWDLCHDILYTAADNAYNFIAHDINKDGKLNVSDLIEIRNLFKEKGIEITDNSGKPELLKTSSEIDSSKLKDGINLIALPLVMSEDEFELEIAITGIPETGLRGLEFAVEYNTSLFEITDCEYKNLNYDAEARAPFEYYNDKKNGKINCLFAAVNDESDYWLNGSGTILKIKGKIKPATAVGDVTAYFNIVPVRDEVTACSSNRNYNVNTLSGELRIIDEEVNYGDANCDGKVDVSDAVMVKCYLINSKEYNISARGKKNADVQGNGNGINAQDAVAIQKYILKQINSLPV